MLQSSAEELLANLKSYSISRNSGFVPDEGSQPLPKYFKPWEELAAKLPVLLQDPPSFRQHLRALPALDAVQLGAEAEWKRAYAVLAFLIHGLCHGCDEQNVPPSLSDPFLKVCDHLGSQPVLSYAGLCLYNWADGSTHAGLPLRSQFSFTGTIDEEAFYLTPVLVELAGGQLPAQMLQALVDAGQQNWNAVADALDVCAKTLIAMAETLGHLKLCQPDVFYNQIRPYIAGLKVSFERQDAEPLPVNLVGGSAVQSSPFQFLDHVLGVKHANPLPHEMRAYMPRAHRQFLEYVDTLPSLPALVEKGNADQGVLTGLSRCCTALSKLRTKHIAIVTRYITIPAHDAVRKHEGNSVQVTGTAGSSPVVFLKEMRDDTAATTE